MNAAIEPTSRNENRRYHRVEGKGLALHLQTRDGNLPGLAVENLSMGGLFVRSNAPLPVGTAVMVQLVRPGLRRVLSLTGRVVSVVSLREATMREAVAGMGISLNRPDGEVRERLRGLVRELAKAPNRDVDAAVVESIRRPQPIELSTPVAPVAAPVMERAEPACEPAPCAPAQECAEPSVDDRDRRIADLEAEVQLLRRELLRRNRTIQDLALRLHPSPRG